MKKFKIITKREEWNEELSYYKSDWYHSWSYHEMSYKKKEGKPILFVLNENKIKIALPLLVRKIPGCSEYKDMTSVYGYPGFLFSNKEAISLYDDFIRHLQFWSKENKVVSIFSRLNSLLIDPKNLKGSFYVGETVLIELKDKEENQKSNYRSVHRNLLRKMEKNGFSADWSNSLNSMNEFKLIYEKNMKILGADNYYFFDNSYYEYFLNNPDFNVRIYNIYFNKKKVCSGIFIFNDEIVQYHLSGVLKEFRKEAPTIMLIDQARKDATLLGYKYLHLGGGLRNKKDGLFNFKRGFSKKLISFYVFKMITNDNVYNRLSNSSEIDNSQQNDFFPIYRKL